MCSSDLIETELDPFMTKADSLTGQVVSKIGNLPEPTYFVKIKLKFFKDNSEKLKPKELLMFGVNTTISVGVIEKINNDEIKINLSLPIVKFIGEDIGVSKNINGHWKLVGFGKIIG